MILERFGVLDRYFLDPMVRNSRLVTETLANATTPIAGAIYVDRSGASFTPCANMTPTTTAVYENTYLRSVYQAIVDDSSYNMPTVSDSEVELIAPVVDCTISSIVNDNPSLGRFNYLARQRRNPQNVSAMVVMLSNQLYFNQARGDYGSVGFAMVYFFHNTSAPSSHGFQILLLIGYPTLKTARRVGYLRKTFSEQSNASNYALLLVPTGLHAFSLMTWLNNPVLHDSWAWVHLVQLAIGLNIASSLVWLCLATYQNFRKGKWWIGDVFVSVSTTQFASGAAVLVSWAMSGFWTLREFCMHDAIVYAGDEQMHIESVLTMVDLLTLYFCACGVIGHLTRERVDPLVAKVTFLVGFEARISIVSGLAPSLWDEIVAYYRLDLARSISPKLPGQEMISPMRVWSAYDIGTMPASFILQCIMPIFLALALVVVYVIVRKIYRHFYPESIHIQRNTTGTVSSDNERSAALVAMKRVYTVFELATGAQLENRFGLVADFETCRFIKGMKYASADGIYTTGFVIANHKFLVQTRDLWSIVLMKIVRKRFRNIDVCEVNGSTVQQTARLVYPHTLTFLDLLKINVSVLS